MDGLAIVAIAGVLRVVGTTFVHDEVLRSLNAALPTLAMPRRARRVVVILAAFVARAVEMALCGGALYALVAWLEAGHLNGASGFSFPNCLCFSAETYTSLGSGDLTPEGPVRLLAGMEALNGLLLIGGSASFIYLSMARFWHPPTAP